MIVLIKRSRNIYIFHISLLRNNILHSRSEHGDTIYIILLALLIVLTLTLLGFQIFGFCNRLREQKRPTTSEEER